MANRAFSALVKPVIVVALRTSSNHISQTVTPPIPSIANSIVIFHVSSESHSVHTA